MCRFSAAVIKRTSYWLFIMAVRRQNSVKTKMTNIYPTFIHHKCSFLLKKEKNRIHAAQFKFILTAEIDGGIPLKSDIKKGNC